MAESEANELREAYAKRLQELQAKAARDAQLRQVLQTVLDSAAYERMANIRTANPELYEKLALVIVQLAQRGQLQSKLSENDLRQLVERVNPRRETRITRISRK